MKKATVAALPSLLVLASTGLAAQEGRVHQTAFHDFRVTTVAEGLVSPFSMTFTPEGDLLVAERPGRLRIIRDGVLLPEPVQGLPEIIALGRGARVVTGIEQAGLRDVVLHPDFATNRLLYLSYTKPGADSLGSLAVVRGHFDGNRLTDVQEIFHADAHGPGTQLGSQWGGRIAFDGKGYIYITVGDRQWPPRGDLEAHPAQDLSNHNGTTVRLHEDGRVPADNPFVDRPDVLPEIWTYGHRNAQGLAVHPTTGDVWLHEHGPQGGDELNLLRPGLNYGWPVVGYGVNYRTGLAIHEGTTREGMEPPVHVWVPSIGISGMLFYTGDAFPAWRGDLLVGGLGDESLVRLRLEGAEVVWEEMLLRGLGRIRDVRQGPDGLIYLALDGGTRGADGPPTRILRLEPAGMQQQGIDDGDWPHYARDLAATKYSPLDQIDLDNVADLEIVWTWESADYRLAGEHAGARVNPNFQATPIKVGDRLYTSTNLGQAVALDPATGEELWRYDPYASGLRTATGGRANRGVAYWSDGSSGRILLGSGEYLVSLDARTGVPDPSFGAGGAIDLSTDPDPRVLTYNWTSAPLVVRDVVIVGATSMAPNRNWKTAPPGYVRAYDVRTGALRWRFNPIPEPGDPAIETWADSSWVYSGNGNVWTLMSADEELGLVYLPLKTTTNDWYGGHRIGDNLYGESVVAVDVDTGERVWHYQTVRHGLWDYDPPAAPNLLDIVVDGRPVKALAQVTKQAWVFALDRETGEPIWPIEDRPVPPSDVPGEVAARTQPFPTRPAPFDLQGITHDDLIDFTPELRAEAESILERFVYGPIYTPPSVRGEGPDDTQGTILMPGWVGGANWGGAAVDPETGVLYVPSVTSPSVTALVPPPNPDSSDFRYVRGTPREVPMPGGLPLLKPPYGRTTAIDMNTGDHLWMRPNGPGPRDHPAIAHLELPWLGQRGRPAPLLTRTLLFLGEGSEAALSILPIAGGKAFRAWDKRTGDVVWETELAAGTSGAPMTYLADGRQFIVVAIGDGDTRGQLVAFALPRPGS